MQATPAPESSTVWTFLSLMNSVLGVGVMLALGFTHAYFMATIHENDMWFSNLQVGVAAAVEQLFCVPRRHWWIPPSNDWRRILSLGLLDPYGIEQKSGVALLLGCVVFWRKEQGMLKF